MINLLLPLLKPKFTAMKKQLCLFTIFSLISVLQVFADDDKEKKKIGFAVHNAEVQVTAHADYFFYVKGKDAPAIDKPYDGRYPFIGLNFGVQYLFRPIYLLAVSAGINFHMQGAFSRNMQYFPKEYVASRSNYHLASLMIPLYLHLYKRMPHSTFEFAAGPDFYLPVFQRWATSNYSVNGDKTASDSDIDRFTMRQIRNGAVLGLSIFLGAQLRLCASSDLFIGPQIAFANLAFFDLDTQKPRLNYGSFYDVYLGIKLGFRFHCKKE